MVLRILFVEDHDETRRTLSRLYVIFTTKSSPREITKWLVPFWIDASSMC